MSVIREIREMTGLSLNQVAEWLGVSKSMIHLAEKGQRNLDRELNTKLYSAYAQLKGLQGNLQPGPVVPAANPTRLAERHRKKMEYHQRSAEGLRLMLEKIAGKPSVPDLQTALFDAILNGKAAWAEPQDMMWADMMKSDSDARQGAARQDLLKDKIETHLAYAELHKKRWEGYEGMRAGEPIV